LDLVEVQKTLKKLGLKSTIKDIGRDKELRLTQHLSFMENSGPARNLPARSMTTSHNFDYEPYWFSITASFKDSSNRYKLDKTIFDELLKTDLREATHGRNPQWGTYKFAIRSKEDLDKVIEIIKSHSKEIKKLGFHPDWGVYCYSNMETIK